MMEVLEQDTKMKKVQEDDGNDDGNDGGNGGGKGCLDTRWLTSSLL
jgi:hypothetical protein